MNTVKFSDIKEKLQAALSEKLKRVPILEERGFTIIEGFMCFPIQAEIPEFDMGPRLRSIPAIAIVGDTSGRIYTFALKAILPGIDI